MNPLYVGIDVSSRNNVVFLMKPDGSKIKNFGSQLQGWFAKAR